MKYRKYILLIFMIILPATLRSQFIDAYGLKTAYTFSRIIPRIAENFPDSNIWHHGINMAVFAEKDIYKIFHIVSQLEYAPKGYVLEQIETNEVGEEVQTVNASTRLDYISVPIFLKICNNNLKFRPFVQLGPRLDYLIGYKKGIYKFTKVHVPDEMPDFLYLHSFSYGYSLSGGFSFPIKHNRIIIEARYNSDHAGLPSMYNIFFGKKVSYDLWFGFSF